MPLAACRLPLAFEYNPRKAARNLNKHSITFMEAMRVFNDPFAQTCPMNSTLKPKIAGSHSGYITARLLLVSHIETNDRIRLIGARNATAQQFMTTKSAKPARKQDSLAPRPLDLSKAVPGKYYERMQEGSNLVLIAPDLMETFPDSESVNEALRSLKIIANRTRKAS